MKWIVVNNASEIDNQWDCLAGDNIFLTKQFLSHLEQVNPCNQSYNLLYENNKLQAIYVDYHLKVDIFTYSWLNLKFPVRIMGIPCSVSKPGFSICAGYEKYMLKHFQGKKGAKLILNSNKKLTDNKGETLPTCRLAVRWTDFRQYLHAMRSNYRYRIKKALKKWQGVVVEYVEPTEFDIQLYQYYIDVFENSQAKLEKLSFKFFQEMPLPSVVIRASYQGNSLGFVQLVANGEELIFLFTGFNYQLNKHFDIYLNLLLEIVRYGVDNGFKVIDLGQTAEETKLKLGSKLKPNSMYVGHSNLLLDRLANKYIKLLGYQIPKFNFNVFNKEGLD